MKRTIIKSAKYGAISAILFAGIFCFFYIFGSLVVIITEQLAAFPRFYTYIISSTLIGGVLGAFLGAIDAIQNGDS